MSHSESTFPAAGAPGEVGPLSTYFPPALRAVTAQRAAPATLVQGFFLLLIQLYRWFFSPAQVFLFGGGSGCRFTPTCSQYAAEAIRHRGVLAGGALAVGRICRCHPLGGCGHDPVPESRKERRSFSNG